MTDEKIIKSKYKTNIKYNSKNNDAIAYASVWNEINDAKFLSSLLKNNIKVRFNKKDIKSGKLNLTKGSLIIYKGDQTIENFENILFLEANKFNIEILDIYTGISTSGPDLGSD